jgi:hypothetical protein
VHPKTDDVTSDIKRAIDAGAVGAYVHGGAGDSFVKGGRVDLLGKAVEFIKSQRVLAGIGGHSLEVPKAVEKAGIQPDFYMKTLHHDRYWSATPKEQRAEFIVDSFGPEDHDNIWCITPEKDIEFMRTVARPWIAFKVLAAGAIHPREGFKFAFDNADYLVLAFDRFARAIIARTQSRVSDRQRPWRSGPAAFGLSGCHAQQRACLVAIGRRQARTNKFVRGTQNWFGFFSGNRSDVARRRDSCGYGQVWRRSLWPKQ